MPIETVSKLLGHKDIRTTRELEHLSRRTDTICSKRSGASGRRARHAADTLSNARFGEGLRLKNTNIIYESACYDP